MAVSKKNKAKFGIEFLGDDQIRQEFRKIYECFICVNENNKDPDTALNPKEFRIFCHLLRSTNRGGKTEKSKGFSDESLKTIGEKCGINKDTAGKWIKELERKKIITIEVIRKKLSQSDNQSSHQVHIRKINKSLNGINSLNQVFIHKLLDDYRFTPTEFRVYFHIIFKHEFPDIKGEETNIITSPYFENSFSLPMVEVNVLQDSKKLKIAERTLQMALQSLEKKKVIVADPKKYVSGTNQAISYEIRGISDPDPERAIQEEPLSNDDAQIPKIHEEQQREKPNLDDIPF